MADIFYKPKRVTAGALHFCVSLSIFSLILAVLINFWYPGVSFNDSGGWQGIRIVAGVDVVLGPLLTFIVFNPQKDARELRSDIGVIVAMQLAALLWGIYTLYSQRPAAVVFWEENFMTIPAQAFSDQGYPLSGLRRFSDASPPIIYAEKPTKLEELEKMLDLIKKDQIPPHEQPWLYSPLKEHFNDIKPLQLDIDATIAKHPEVKGQLSKIQQQYAIKDIHGLLYFLLQSKYKDSVMVFDKDANYLGYLSAD